MKESFLDACPIAIYNILMIKNKTIIGGLLMSIVSLIAFAGIMSSVNSLESETDSPLRALIARQITISVQPMQDTMGNAYSDVSIEYPKFRGSNLAGLNAAITKHVNDTKTEFLKMAEEGWKARLETARPGESIPEFPARHEGASLVISWSLEHFSNDMVSLRMNVSQYTFGAHPIELIKTFNYDIEHTKLLTLADIYTKEPSYIAKVSKEAVAQLSRLYVPNATDKASVIDGAGPSPKNFETFTTDGSMVTIYFQTYQVGPRPLGQPSVTLPISLQ